VECPHPLPSGAICGAFARLESGGAICQRGHCFLLRRILPRDHPLSGRDAYNRIRQRATDASMTRPGRTPEFIYDMIERLEELEWRHRAYLARRGIG